MSDNSLNVSSLFHKGKLIQIGDIIACKVEFLDTAGTGRFNHFDDGGVLTNIRVKVDTVCNSCYLNHGFTYNSVGGLGYTFEFDNGSRQYAFESDAVTFPYLINEKIKYINKYYNHEVNKDKAENLIKYLGLPVRKDLGTYLKKYNREIFDYLCLTFRIRFGEFGVFTDTDSLTDVALKTLRQYGGYDNNTKNVIHNLVSNNNNESGNSYFKNLKV